VYWLKRCWRHELIAVVAVLRLTLLQIIGEAHVVMRTDHQARVLSLQPLSDGRNLLGQCLLLREQMVQSEHEESIRVVQNPVVDRQLVARLIDALKYGDRMAGDVADHLLEIECGSVEELERSRDPLEEVHRVPLCRLVRRPRYAPYLRDRREAVVQLSRVTIGFPRIAPGPVDAHATLSWRIPARHVILVVRSWRLRNAHDALPLVRATPPGKP